ncbi:putative TAP-like protein-domain-containing protein [Seiridium unicorne]|uniref:TAP-like protein-domain-containing protein n=1 Tax=Seiridium unicorne TaxID=138068 RepID=A0ABR2V0E9_9PEZI
MVLRTTLLLASHLALVAAYPKVEEFDWTTINASTALDYSPCYNATHKCAKLTVPLDWLDTSNPKRVTLAIITRPATVNESDPTFGGTIIVNPGGPSGSGVDFVLRAGEVIQRTVSSDTHKFEILSFDPRGVGLTEPFSDCYRDEFARATGTLIQRGLGAPDEGDHVVRRLYSLAQAFGELCTHGADGEDDIKYFMSTSSVARDMVEIVDKLAELRNDEEKQQQTMGQEANEQRRLELRSGANAVDSTPRINYWGFSYGTVLGNYFASMFPGRVGRVALEAVEDVDDYYAAAWSNNLPDTQQTLNHFWETCFAAQGRCALYKSSDESPKSIEARVRDFLDSLETSPAPYIHPSGIVVAITPLDVLKTLFRPLYQPLRDFPELAETLAAAMDGNFTQIYGGLELPTPDESCPLRIPSSYTWHEDAQQAIACGDGISQNNLTVPEFLDHLARLEQDSPDFGRLWSGIRLSCAGWKFRPKYRFSGPWTTPEADSSLVEGKPAAPLLILSSRYDPVTPLANAHRAAERHPGSRVLVQNNVGHGSVLSPGKCREDHIKKYFATGELPPEGTVCQPDCTPFQDCPQFTGAFSSASTSLEPLKAWSPRAPLGVGF